MSYMLNSSFKFDKFLIFSNFIIMLILTEKPNVALDIANALGGFTHKRGFFIKGEDCITYAFGHLLELFSPQDYDASLKNWNLEQLPIIPKKIEYKPKTSKKIEDQNKIATQLEIIKMCFDKYSKNGFILATDAEREGELIGALILKYVGFKDYENAKRFWVSEALSKDVVLAGLKKAMPLSNYESYKNAGYARQQADWLIGMNFSRLLSVKANTKLTFGRVQSAILGAIYLREMGIKKFIPELYFVFQATVQKNGIEFSLVLNKEDGSSKIYPQDPLLDETLRITKNSKIKIQKIETEHKKENPPQLFNITGLQKYCASKYKISPEKTLEIAQELYEKRKCLSYPRTPSVVLGESNVELYRQKFNLLKKHFPEFAKDCNELNINENYKHLFNSKKLQDHHALIPLDILGDNASDDEKKVYLAVVERFFQVIKIPFEYDQTKVYAECENLMFSTTGKKITVKGWKNVLSENSENEENQTLPELFENEELQIIKTENLEKWTTPKKHFTFTSLLALMENPKNEDKDKYEGKLVGLGTSATRAEIIKKLIGNNYIEISGQNILITKKGIFLIEAVKKIPVLANFISIKTTTIWEEKLQTEPKLFFKDIKTFIEVELPKMKTLQSVQWTDDNFANCPICGKNLLHSKFGVFCSGKKDGCNFHLNSEYFGKKLSMGDIIDLTTKGRTKILKFKCKKNGKKYSAFLFLNKEFKIEINFSK